MNEYILLGVSLFILTYRLGTLVALLFYYSIVYLNLWKQMKACQIFEILKTKQQQQQKKKKKKKKKKNSNNSQRLAMAIISKSLHVGARKLARNNLQYHNIRTLNRHVKFSKV